MLYVYIKHRIKVIITITKGCGAANETAPSLTRGLGFEP